VATFFHPQSGQQFVVEGFIIGGYNIACSLAAILLVEFSAPGRIKVRLCVGWAGVWGMRGGGI
jgi:hypothetical protein